MPVVRQRPQNREPSFPTDTAGPSAVTKPAEPDIHIHIGRLEVRAAAASPSKRPPQSQPRKRATAIRSLSDYLKDRG